MFKLINGSFLTSHISRLIISAVILRIITLFLVLLVTVTVLFCLPLLPELSKITSSLPFFPGGVGSLSHFGTVQPQLPVAFWIIRLPVPVFSYLKIHPTFSPSSITPKSCSVNSKVISASPAVPPSELPKCDPVAPPLLFLLHPSTDMAMKNKRIYPVRFIKLCKVKTILIFTQRVIQLLAN